MSNKLKKSGNGSKSSTKAMTMEGIKKSNDILQSGDNFPAAANR